MAFEVKQADRVVKSFQTDERGHFHLVLQPGHYTIVRKDRQGAVSYQGSFGGGHAGQDKKVQWQCDSGLR